LLCESFFKSIPGAPIHAISILNSSLVSK
jgi:hypothetical protein